MIHIVYGISLITIHRMLPVVQDLQFFFTAKIGRHTSTVIIYLLLLLTIVSEDASSQNINVHLTM